MAISRHNKGESYGILMEIREAHKTHKLLFQGCHLRLPNDNGSEFDGRRKKRVSLSEDNQF